MSKETDTVLMNTPFKGVDKIREVYFIGIGVIGMSAVARFFHSKGVKVSGYDKTSTVLTKELEASGIAIHYEENVDLIPKDADLVVYTPAVPKDHKELVYYQQHGNKVVKRSDVLQLISEGSFNICIAGTHGKTTITTMVAHLLRDTGFGCNAFLGGISGTAESVEQAFIDFSKKVKPGGLLITQFGLKRGKELSADRQLIIVCKMMRRMYTVPISA